MGGTVATRSIGQFSTLYGAIEDMVVGLEAVLADGTVTRIKTYHAARQARHSSHHHRQRRCIVLYH
ncbi:FAD-dependent oxidoreductase [Escherichia coli]|nr:FAD-dependent oxidoreductase [Escherichia coli]